MHLEDDLDGGPAEDTIQFSLDGKDYEIDLSATYAEKPHEALRLYTAASRETTRTGGTRTTRDRASSSDHDTAKIRACSKENGHDVCNRGCIHHSNQDAYYAAQ